MADQAPSNIAVELEYRVKPVTRYVVTRYTQNDARTTGCTEQRGEYDNPEIAHAVAYALCKAEHDMLGWPPGDPRIQYPPNLKCGAASAG